jgi:hypothetical protein
LPTKVRQDNVTSFILLYGIEERQKHAVYTATNRQPDAVKNGLEWKTMEWGVPLLTL